MVKLLVFAILLASSPATGLLETLFRTENTCYSGCHSNYATDAMHLESCKKGCDFKLLNEDCASKCQSHSNDAKLQSSCQIGCTLSRPADEVVTDKPVIAIDPVPEVKLPEIVSPNPESGRPRSIILIRLRNRPSIELPSGQRLFGSDPMQMFNDMLRRFQEHTQSIEQSIRQSFEQSSQDPSKPSDLGAVSDLVKSIPLIRIPSNVRADSSSESSEESNDKRPLINEFKHVIQHPREHQQYVRERMRPVSNRLQQLVSDIRSEWNDLVRKQPKIPVWIFIGILLSSSAILWYMVMSLCRHTPSRNALSVRAQELIYHPYGYEGCEKEKIQPDDQPYEVTESLPIKVKLSNI